ncbi:MAG: transketolase C-terminal domain-containing protein [Pseudomonadota bacterium]
MSRMTFQQAVVDAIASEMRRDRDVFVMGEDIGRFGGPLRSNAGLFEEFGAEGRVIDTPISEGTFVGVGVGAALQGKRPVVDLMFLEFLALVMQQFLDAGAMHYYSGGTARVPLVVRAKYGVGPFHGHAYDHHSWLMNVPGVKIVAPSNPADAAGLMRAAIRDDNPTLFLEHMALYHAGRAEIPEGDHVVPLGKAAIARSGTDLTIVASALMLRRALAAADALAEAGGPSAEVVDLRTIAPIDEETVLTSVRKTGRLVLVSEAVERGSSINDVAALVAEKAFTALKAPIARVAPPAIPTPFARELEKIYLPDATRITEAARGLFAAAA